MNNDDNELLQVLRDVFSMSKPERQLIALLSTKGGRGKEHDSLTVTGAEWAEVFGNAPGTMPYETLSAVADSLLHRAPVSVRIGTAVYSLHWVTGVMYFPDDKEVQCRMHPWLSVVMGNTEVGDSGFNLIVNKKVDAK